MTKYLLTIILINISINFLGQNYQPVCKVQSISWNYIQSILTIDRVHTDSLVITKDTLYEGETYYELFNYCLFDMEEDSIPGYLREDTISGKLWYRKDLGLSKEYLIMDLSISVGDTFYFQRLGLDSIEIQADSIYIDSENRKHVLFKDFHRKNFNENENGWPIDTDYPEFEFIEGVGPTASIFYQEIGVIYSEPFLYTILLCSHKTNQTIYTNEVFSNECRFSSLGISEQKSEDKIKVYPNPSSNNLKIEFENPNNEKFSFFIYSSSGQIIYSIITQKNIITLEKILKSEGIYFYKLTNLKDKEYNGKIILNN